MFSKWRYVYELYKEKSFTNASKNLFISQPSLSAAIKNTENKIGAQLFERTGHGLELTEVGREYINAAEQIMNVENEFEKRLGDIYNLESGSVIIGGANYVSSYILPRIITKFHLLHPNITIQHIEANSYNLNRMLASGEIDLVVDSLDDAHELTKYPLCREKIYLCVPKNHEINKGLEKHQIKPEFFHDSTADIDSIEPVSISVFKDERYVLLKEGYDMYIRTSKIFQKKSIEPNVIFSVDQLNISYALAESGIGLCFITDTFFRYGNYRENVVLYRIAEEIEERKMYVAHRSNKYCTKAMRELIKVAQGEFC